MDRPRDMKCGAPVAALPMYDFPEIAAANDALWRRIHAGLRARGIEGPERLTRGGDLNAIWRDPGLVLAQTCGYPLVSVLGDAVTLIATPEYAFPGCDGAAHRSFVMRRAGDRRGEIPAFRGAIAAINSRDSNSGMNLFRATVAPHAAGRPFFSKVVVTGSHAASLAAVAQGRADLAAIDCVTYGLLKRHCPEAVSGTALVAETLPSPGLPFIASSRLPEGAAVRIREALVEALEDPDLAGTRDALGLKAARPASVQDYRRVLEIEQAAAAAGYPSLA
jgi:ABC-type phosphate/phosphonate transport system substrate-binding protein